MDKQKIKFNLDLPSALWITNSPSQGTLYSISTTYAADATFILGTPYPVIAHTFYEWIQQLAWSNHVVKSVRFIKFLDQNQAEIAANILLGDGFSRHSDQKNERINLLLRAGRATFL